MLWKFYLDESVASQTAPRVSNTSKMLKHDVCNDNNFIVQTVSETYVQCVRHSFPRPRQLLKTSLFTDAVINTITLQLNC